MGSKATPRRSAGFTMVEMLVVLAILGILMGISIGAFRKSVPSRDVARNAVLDALRQARLFAVAENAPASVHLDLAEGEGGWPTVTARGRRTVGGWHLESTALEGWPDAAHGGGLEEEPKGALGHAVALSDVDPSWVDFGASPAFDAEEGFALEFFVKTLRPRSQVLFSKGKGFTLRSEADGALTLEVRVQRLDEQGQKKLLHLSQKTPAPVLVAGRFVKVVASYDGLEMRLSADDVVALDELAPRPEAFAPDRESPLVAGSDDAPAGFTLDEVKFGIFAGDSQPLRDMELGSGAQAVHFAPDGTLDPRFHQGPVELLLISPRTRKPDDPPEQRGVETWIRVGTLGDVH
jgi:prepilin-type N-terminal cleavage/methylation domain-containing protein